jgi:hypothetical protein
VTVSVKYVWYLTFHEKQKLQCFDEAKNHYNKLNKEVKMVAVDRYADFQDHYEYHGSTTIERIRKKRGLTVWRDWILFDSVEEAAEYFNDNCWREEGLC